MVRGPTGFGAVGLVAAVPAVVAAVTLPAGVDAGRGRVTRDEALQGLPLDLHIAARQVCNEQ